MIALDPDSLHVTAEFLSVVAVLFYKFARLSGMPDFFQSVQNVVI